jgi:hypothetical protein
MAKSLTRPAFAGPAPETLTAIENERATHELQAATFKYQTKMRDLERAFEAKAAELREEYISDIRTLTGDAE